MYEDLALLAAFVLIYSSVAGAIERSWVSGPILFTLFGVIIGPVVLDLHTLDISREGVRLLAELTLALVLFTDAAGADIGVLRKTKAIPVRLLFVGLPLTILFGIGTGMLLFGDLSFFAVAILATMLAPTDAALGKGVVSNPKVPAETKQGLNVESGLNDGICVPVLLMFLELALGKGGEEGPLALALHLVVEEIGIGLVVGLGVSFLASWVLKVSRRRGWLTHTWIQVPVVGLALSCFAIAQSLGGSGFIAAFVGGILFGILAREEREEYLRAAEGTGDTLALLTWVIFGTAVVGQAFGDFGWTVVLYSVLSLTVIRMLPVFLGLVGSDIDTEGKLFIGWFGPRGLASIVFAVMVLNSGVEGSGTLAMTAVCTIILSVILHGITANPWAEAYGDRRASREGGSD